MDIYGGLTYWIFKPEVWVILGIILIILDIFIGFDFFVLPVGIASFILSGIIYAQINSWFGEAVILESWKSILIIFALLSILSIGIIKFIFQISKKKRPDINQY